MLLKPQSLLPLLLCLMLPIQLHLVSLRWLIVIRLCLWYSRVHTLQQEPVPLLMPSPLLLLILPSNLSFSLKLFPLPFLLNLLKPIPLKLNLSRIQRLNSYYSCFFFILSGLKLNCEPLTKDFPKVVEDPYILAKKFKLISLDFH